MPKTPIEEYCPKDLPDHSHNGVTCNGKVAGVYQSVKGQQEIKRMQAECAVQMAINNLGRTLENLADPSLDDLPCSNLDASGFMLPAARDCVKEAVKQLRAVRKSLKGRS